MEAQPSPTDLANATAFIDGEYAAQVSPEYLAFHREQLIRHVAVAEMQKRQHAEWKARFAAERRAA